MSDDKDWDAIRKREQEKRDAARERAYQTAAADEQAQIQKDDEDFMRELKAMGPALANMSDAQIEKGLRNAKKGGRRLTSSDRAKIKRAKRIAKGDGCFGLFVVLGLPVVYGCYELVSYLI